MKDPLRNYETAKAALNAFIAKDNGKQKENAETIPGYVQWLARTYEFKYDDEDRKLTIRIHPGWIDRGAYPPIPDEYFDLEKVYGRDGSGT